MSRERPGDRPIAFETVRTERLSDGFRALDAASVSHATLSGAGTMSVRREILRGGTAAAVIPYDPATGQLVVIRQFRAGAALAGLPAALLELPAGLVDAGEDAKAAAVRELREETGLKPHAITQAFSILSSPGLTDERAIVFLALVDASTLTGTGGLAEEHEDIETIAAPLAELLKAADEGRIANGFLFASLQWFARRGADMAAGLQSGAAGELLT